MEKMVKLKKMVNFFCFVCYSENFLDQTRRKQTGSSVYTPLLIHTYKHATFAQSNTISIRKSKWEEAFSAVTHQGSRKCVTKRCLKNHKEKDKRINNRAFSSMCIYTYSDL